MSIAWGWVQMQGSFPAGTLGHRRAQSYTSARPHSFELNWSRRWENARARAPLYEQSKQTVYFYFKISTFDPELGFSTMNVICNPLHSVTD